jgi:hypothetical protein
MSLGPTNKNYPIVNYAASKIAETGIRISTKAPVYARTNSIDRFDFLL